MDIYLSFETAGGRPGQGFGYQTYIKATTMGKDIEDLFDSDECYTKLGITPFSMNRLNFKSEIALCDSNLYSVLESTLRALFTVVPFLVPVLVITMTCVVQVIVLYKPRSCPTSTEQRHATITVFLMSVLFVVCNSAYAIYTLLLKFKVIFDPQILTMAVLGTVLPILNAALNPVIIISRCSGLRGKFVEKLSMRERISVRENTIALRKL